MTAADQRLLERIDRFNQRTLLRWDESRHRSLRRRFERMVKWAQREHGHLPRAEQLLRFGWLALEVG